MVTCASVAAAFACTQILTRRPGSGGNWMNVLKVIVFAVVILGGLFAWWRDQPPALRPHEPLFTSRPGGTAYRHGIHLHRPAGL